MFAVVPSRRDPPPSPSRLLRTTSVSTDPSASFVVSPRYSRTFFPSLYRLVLAGDVLAAATEPPRTCLQVLRASDLVVS